ncbi:C3H1-type domain-containing protein [Aphelenchoides fujianensis]|nr:C3H1-type domain-containing protein [Aphelenchoides fujianensis]
MKIDNVEKLTEWIKKRISEICDAEPEAFSKYVVALLKKDDSEEKLRAICVDQLNVFLGDSTSEFVDHLFETLDKRSYLKGGEPSAPSSPNERAADLPPAVDSKNSAESRPPRRRISPPRDSKADERKEPAAANKSAERRRRSRSRSPLRRRPYSTRDRSARRSRSRSRSRSPGYRRDRDYHRRDRSDRPAASSQPNRRVRCPDYEEKGYCRRGEKCLFDHGPDPIILNDNNADNFRPEFNGKAPAEGAPPAAPYIPSATSVQPEAYNPEAPALSGAPTIPGFVPDFSMPPPPMGVGMIPVNPYLAAPGMLAGAMGPMRGGPLGFRGFGRGRGRGRFGQYSERVQPNKSTTIEVRRIPPEVNKLGIINNHFAQYGDITNIQISFDGSPDTALVTYAKLPDAQAAMKSQKPILDNRFIQVAWHKPPPPAPIVDPKAVQPTNGNAGGDVQPAIALATDAAADKAPVRLPQSETARKAAQIAEEKLQQRRKERQRVAHLQEVLTLKGKLYEKQAAELKSLFERMAKITDAKVKGQCVQLVKTLDQQMKTTSAELHELHDELKQLKSKQKRAASDDEDSSAEKPAPKKRAGSPDAAGDAADAPKSDEKPAEGGDAETTADSSQLADESTIRKLLEQSDDEEDDEVGAQKTDEAAAQGPKIEPVAE